MTDAPFQKLCDDPADGDAVRDVVEILHPLLLGGVFRLGGTRDDFEELVGETILELLAEIPKRELRSFESARRFTAVVVRNRLLNLKRSARRRSETLEGYRRSGMAEADTPEPTGQLGARELLDALEELAPEHQAVIRDRLLWGLSFEEIAEARGCSVGAARALFHRSIRKAREIIYLRHGPPGA